MFTDLALSRDLMQDFLEYKRKKGDIGTLQKLNVMVLQRSNWPFTARKNDVDLPRWVCTCAHEYQRRYLAGHVRRR